ncbi:helix-turn-helix domain-containing protein [Breznakia pachnodae]|uniref:AraC-like DNA-binding protein n=1 Tax=Breznakia pachnodae TaxID=265178 RepID=A0ABU0E3I1_9FIRM|nr:helix-turn-helix domain-containing protein [Breznakia pachnodae]MDQ0361365.1 AraC-like DNA-binding protein [Breznakia pachnodae]
MLKSNRLKHIGKDRVVIDSNDSFAYVLPCDKLQHLISNFTITFPDEIDISDNYTVLPHGSVTLVFFNNATGLHSLLFGPTTQPKVVGDMANKCDIIFIIEFQPAGFFPFSKIKQNDLINEIYSFSFINPVLDFKMKEIFKKTETAEELLTTMEELLLQNIQYNYPVQLASAISLITQKSGMITAEEVSSVVGYSNRQLNRFFNEYLGMSMKAFSRIVRINNSFRLLNNSKESLSVITEKLGYYDVSHFVKDFKIVCGIRPDEYRKNLSDYYSEVSKF